MDYRNILATGFLLLCGAVFIHSLKSANAFPQGPTVSMGSNPLEHHHQTCNSNRTAHVYTNTSTLDFIITDIIAHNTVHIHVDNVAIAIHPQGTSNLKSGIRILPGETVTCGDGGSYLTIVG